MRSGKKETNIFSMSALDLFASALGGFILLTVIFMPFFPNVGDSPEKVAELKAQIEQLEGALEVCQDERDQAIARSERAEGDLEECRAELRKKFLLIVISWGRRDDVDLHVVDPEGREFYFDQRRHSGSRAAHEEDNTRGPGNEIWLHPAATPGTYKVFYKLYTKRSGSVSVRGAVLTPAGRQQFPEVTLSRHREKPLVATVVVDGQGNATVEAR